MRYAAEIMGVIINFLKKSEDRLSDFDKIMHGARANIEAVIKNLQLFEDRPELINIMNEELDYILPNSISFLHDVKWQIERIEAKYRDITTDIGPVKLTGDVLINIVKLADKITDTLSPNNS